jgi:hypothetical protein
MSSRRAPYKAKRGSAESVDKNKKAVSKEDDSKGRMDDGRVALTHSFLSCPSSA